MDCSSSNDSVSVTENLSTFGEELSRKVAGPNVWYCLKKYLLQVFFDLKLNTKCDHMYHKKRLCLQDGSSDAFPGKCFVQYKLMLNLFYRMKHNELSGIHCRIVHVCAKKHSVVKSRDAIGEKEEEARHSLWSVEGIPISPYSSPADSITPQNLTLFHISSS